MGAWVARLLFELRDSGPRLSRVLTMMVPLPVTAILQRSTMPKFKQEHDLGMRRCRCPPPALQT